MIRGNASFGKAHDVRTKKAKKDEEISIRSGGYKRAIAQVGIEQLKARAA